MPKKVKAKKKAGGMEDAGVGGGRRPRSDRKQVGVGLGGAETSGIATLGLSGYFNIAAHVRPA